MRTESVSARDSRLKRLLIPKARKKQKFLPGTIVYIRPIYEMGMVPHFDCDKVDIVKGSYADEYGGSNVKDYSLSGSAWYQEDQLMPAEGLSLKECRLRAGMYFGKPYQEMLGLRAKEIERVRKRFASL
jgi:hypothetical protein